MKSDRFINSGIYSTRIGVGFLLTSLLLLAVSTVPEIGTVEAQVLEKVFLYFAFLIAPLFICSASGWRLQISSRRAEQRGDARFAGFY
jgi:hypothetical protein